MVQDKNIMYMKIFRPLAPIIGALVMLSIFSGRPAFAATNKTLGTYPGAVHANDVVVLDNIAYVADGTDGVIALNISNPASPTLVGSYDTPGDAHQLEGAGNYLFVADGTSLQILNISSPSAMTLAGSYSQAGFTVTDVTTDGTYAYITGSLIGTTTFEVVNISNPAAPSLTGILTVKGRSGVFVSGTYAYLVGDNFLDIVNVSIPSIPSLTGEYVGGSGLAFDSVQVIGAYAYINDSMAGLQVVNVSNPASPTLASGSTVAGNGLGGGIASSNGYIFLTSSAGGLAIYDIFSTGLPVFVDT